MPIEMTANDMLDFSRALARKLNNFGFSLQPEHIVSCELFSSDDTLGYTEILGEHKFRLNINKKLCKQMGKKSLERFNNNFSMTRYVNNYSKEYAKIIKEYNLQK